MGGLIATVCVTPVRHRPRPEWENCRSQLYQEYRRMADAVKRVFS